MVFTTLEFLFLFFPSVLIGYLFINPKRGLENLWLFFASLVFYYIGAKENFWLLIAVILIAYVGGLLESRLVVQLHKKVVLFLTVILMLVIMLYFKYFNFFISNINVFFNKNLENKEIALPIGISFFIFQAISYIVDVYRGEEALVNPVDMGLYISFFPQLIAGPIVRFHDIREYLRGGTENLIIIKFRMEFGAFQ